MREEIRQLVQLQELDTTARKLQTVKEKLTKDLTDAERGVVAEKENQENRTSEIKTFRKALDKREGDLKDIEAKVQKLEVQLNTVKTNKEYAAIQHEILGLKADKSKVEDEIIKMMEQTESQQREVKELAKRVSDAMAAVQGRKKSIEDAIADADARIEQARQERADLAGRIPPSFLAPYERLLTRAGGRAIVAARNYICDGCKMTLTANTVALLMSGDKLINCHSCGRILYLAENEDLTGIATAGRKDTW